MGQGRRSNKKLRLPMLAPGDTLLRALSLMKRARTELLPVVCAGGMLVGLVTENRVLDAWHEGPLDPVALVMTPVEQVPPDETELLPTG